MYGIIKYNNEGKPQCELCGKYFHRVLTHVRQKHFMTELEYKKMFGLDVQKGILSKTTREKSQRAVKRNYEKVVTVNLITKGTNSRFKEGNLGRTGEQVSEQTRLRLRERLTKAAMIEKLKESGQKVGLSGLGNLKRWGKK